MEPKNDCSPAPTYPTLVTILLTAITLLMAYFGLEARTNRDEITTIKIKRAAEQQRMRQIENDVRVIRQWVELQKRIK